MDPQLKRLIVGVALLGIAYLSFHKAGKTDDQAIADMNFWSFIISGIIGILLILAVTVRWMEFA